MGAGKKINICVFGLWHLGTVTSACLASKGYSITGLDPDEENVQNLSKAVAPIYEPGLEELLKRGLESKNLRFTTNAKEGLKGCDLVWVTFDTPVDEDDNADVESVKKAAQSLYPYFEPGTDVVLSSQVPVGTTARLREDFRSQYPGKDVSFFYSPENLRLGKAIDAFTNQKRIVVGGDNDSDRSRIQSIAGSLCDQIEWMSVESAEMSKHALNAFLASSVTFINELAELCEHVGADAHDVERALKSEPRIGPGAYLKPGPAFAGGTLARDVKFLTELGKRSNIPTPLFSGLLKSNNEHKTWIQRKLKSVLVDLKDKTVAVLGLTYKPGTDTLRRSGAVELCKWLKNEGAKVRAHDPVVKRLPATLKNTVSLHETVEEGVQGADALVIATEWQDYKALDMSAILSFVKGRVVIDASGFLAESCSGLSGIHFIMVGKP